MLGPVGSIRKRFVTTLSFLKIGENKSGTCDLAFVRSLIRVASHMSLQIFMTRVTFTAARIGTLAWFFAAVASHMNPQPVQSLINRIIQL